MISTKITIIVIVDVCLFLCLFHFQSQTYSFEVAQEHIETLQRK